MPSQTLKIINKLGLHARASMKMVDMANRFGSQIHLRYQGNTADAKDILEVMALGASYGTDITIQSEGEDETAAINAIVKLINDRFGEEQ